MIDNQKIDGLIQCIGDGRVVTVVDYLLSEVRCGRDFARFDEMESLLARWEAKLLNSSAINEKDKP